MDKRIEKLKKHFPAAEAHVLNYAIRAPTMQQAIEYLRKIYGNPTATESKWATPINLSRPSTTQGPPLGKPSNTQTSKSQASLFNVETYKIKECRSKAGCGCENFHHEFERRRNPQKYRYSEVPCSAVFNGQWRAPILCSKRDSCNFSHTINESSYHPRIYKTKICLKFEEGQCRHGTRCAFIHGERDPIAQVWKEFEEKREEKIESITGPSLTIAQLIPEKEETTDSFLSPNAWDFAPVRRNPLEELNMELEKRIEELYAKTLCSICFMNEKSVALVPCGHLFCEGCIRKTVSAICVICRRDFSSLLPIFLNS